MMTPETELKRLADNQTWRDLALDFGLPASYLHDVAHGKRPASEKLLEYLGLERVVTYRRRKRNA